MNGHLLAYLAFGGSLWGCTSWQVQDVTPVQLAAGDEGQRVRVTRADGSQVVIDHARVTPAGVSGQWDRTPVVIPITEIRELELMARR